MQAVLFGIITNSDMLDVKFLQLIVQPKSCTLLGNFANLLLAEYQKKNK